MLELIIAETVWTLTCFGVAGSVAWALVSVLDMVGELREEARISRAPRRKA